MENYQKNLIGHALLVLIVGLLAGFMLAFSLIGGLEVMPSIFMGIPVFGTTEGWVRAHSGGIVNALLMIAVAFALPHCGLAPGRLALYAKGIVFVGWANTIFYWAGNMSANRGLSVTATPYGPGDVAGALAFLGGGFGMIFTFIAVALLALAAWKRL